MVARSRSSAGSYAGSYLSMAVLSMLSSSGFSRSSGTAANLLSEVMQRYIQLIGSACVQHANHAGRTTIAPHDLRASLEHLLGGDPIEELFAWAGEENRISLDGSTVDSHVQVMPIGVNGTSQTSNATAGPSSDPLRNPMRGKDLLRTLGAGRVEPTPSVEDELHYRRLDDESYRDLLEEAVLREDAIEHLVWPHAKPLRRQNGSLKGKSKQSDADAMDLDDTASSGSLSHSDAIDAIFFEDEDAKNGLNNADSTTSQSATSHAADVLTYDQRPRKRHRSSSDTTGRQYGDIKLDYIPPFLPLLPETRGPATATGTANIDSQHGQRLHVDVDPEYVEEERKRREAAQRQADEAAVAAAASKLADKVDTSPAGTNGAAAAPLEKTAEERAAEAEKAFEALQARRVMRDSWREAVSFDGSTLEATYPREELQELEEVASNAAKGDLAVSLAPQTSSLRAFAADFKALLEDPTSSGAAGLYLTPSGPAHQDAATKRRRLAHAIADASRFIPNDSLYAAVSVRPSVLPFQPGPSWLVSTLPPPTLYEDNIEVANALSAPVLTPVRPQGRPAALLPPSGALVPTLGYRHPAHLSIGARVVSSAELLRKVSRYEDPPPLLDDKHAERFFHGLPASRDLLGGSGSSSDLSSNISSTRTSGGGGSGSGNSTLRPALEKLVLQMKEKEAEILPEEDKEELQRRQQELQLQLQAALASEGAGGGAKDSAALSSGLIADSYPSRIRNGNITMVHTWDWTPREPFDASLPGKRIRAGDWRGALPFAIEKRIRRDTTVSDGPETNGA
ncbi:hypothetical protein BCV70DRAFT_225782 [Testicularia cyperi]|uniref:Bromodomain associated domain-containing protein n=1 Tax=Testicularia cyperi TaxID=1882483 RepID=A0A317XTW9_9BASI|nr:hypothetical protein BCV70DRAFT_225782 [Testicularia cyperi]